MDVARIRFRTGYVGRDTPSGVRVYAAPKYSSRGEVERSDGIVTIDPEKIKPEELRSVIKTELQWFEDRIYEIVLQRMKKGGVE